MDTLDQARKQVVDLYWLAFLLTGRREASATVTIRALGLPGGSSPFFSKWMGAWSRRLVIAKALAAVRSQLRASARRTARIGDDPILSPAQASSLQGNPTRNQLEHALLAIDIFPRCALLLSVFEGVPLEDAAVLLDAHKELVRKARLIGLLALTRNLAAGQDCPSPGAGSHLPEREVSHA